MYKRGNFMSELLTRIYDYLEEIKDNDKEFYNDVNTFLLSINNSQIPKIFPKYEDAFMNFNEKKHEERHYHDVNSLFLSICWLLWHCHGKLLQGTQGLYWR